MNSMNIVLVVASVVFGAGFIVIGFLYLKDKLNQRGVKKGLKKFSEGEFGFRIGDGMPRSGLAGEINALGAKLGAFFAYVSGESQKASGDKSRLQGVLSVLNDAIIAINKDRGVVVFNAQAEKLLNLSSEQAVGLSVDKVFTLFDGDTELPVYVYAPEEGGSASSSPVLDGQELIVYKKENLTLRTPGNRTREHSINMMTGRLSSGQSAGAQDINYIFIIKDVTLENKLERLKSDFVTVAAHQLRTPLSAVKWAIKMMIDGDMGPVSAEQKSILMKTYESNERMVALVNDLLDAEKLESNTSEYELVPTQIRNLLENLLLEHQPQAQKTGVILTMRKSDEQELPMVAMDQDKIRAVLQNILENAIKYTPAGGEVVVVTESDGNDGVKVGVSDTGIGIPHEEIGHIFTRFYRGSNAIRVHANGTGLGLFISKRIVEDHGGKLWFESSQGKGSSFYFTLPRGE
jgi:signal transduction histidine kinase